MSFTTPKTWVAGTTLTAAELNTHIRDNTNAMIPVTSTVTTTGTQTALAVPDGRGDLVIYANNASTLTINGITAAQNGQRLTIVSIGAGQIELGHQVVTGTTAANRLINTITGSNTFLAAGAGKVTYVYDSTVSRWRLVSHDQGAHISYTATLTGGVAMTGGTITGTFFQRARLCSFVLSVTWGTTSTSGTVSLTLPFTATASGFPVGLAHLIDVSPSTNFTAQAFTGTTTRVDFYAPAWTSALTTATALGGGGTLASGDVLLVQGEYSVS